MTYKNEIFSSPWASLQRWNDSERRRNETVSERGGERERKKWENESTPSLLCGDQTVFRGLRLNPFPLSLISLNYWQSFSLHRPNRINSLRRKEATDYTDAHAVPFSLAGIMRPFRNMNNVLLSECLFKSVACTLAVKFRSRAPLGYQNCTRF